MNDTQQAVSDAQQVLISMMSGYYSLAIPLMIDIGYTMAEGEQKLHSSGDNLSVINAARAMQNKQALTWSELMSDPFTFVTDALAGAISQLYKELQDVQAKKQVGV